MCGAFDFEGKQNIGHLFLVLAIEIDGTSPKEGMHFCQEFWEYPIQWLILETYDMIFISHEALTAHNWQNKKKYSWHVPAMKFIGVKQLG